MKASIYCGTCEETYFTDDPVQGCPTCYYSPFIEFGETILFVELPPPFLLGDVATPEERAALRSELMNDIHLPPFSVADEIEAFRARCAMEMGIPGWMLLGFEN